MSFSPARGNAPWAGFLCAETLRKFWRNSAETQGTPRRKPGGWSGLPEGASGTLNVYTLTYYMWSLPAGCEPRADGFVGDGSDEGLPMTTFFTRRTALGVAVAGALSALTACASDIRPLAGGTGSASPSEAATTSESASASASPSASAPASASAASGLPSSGKSYKGAMKFDSYEKNGEYVPASATNPAENMPKPVPPANMKEHSVDGAYAFLSFWLASLNYLLMTGDMGPIDTVYHKGYAWEEYSSIFKVYALGAGWVYGTETPYIVELLTDAPREVPGSDNTRFIWEGYLYMDPKMVRHYKNQPEKPASADESKKKVARFRLEYKDDKWELSSAA